MRIADNSHLDLTKNSKKRCININSVLSYFLAQKQKGLISMQEHFNTFRPELQGVKNIKTVKISDSYDVYCVRIDKRPHCCGVKPHVKDYRTVNITLPAHNRKK